MSKPKRVLLKISGEALSGEAHKGFDPQAVEYLTNEINDAVKAHKTELAIVIGSGNMIRGSRLSKDLGMTNVIADQTGMLATIINAIVLQDLLEKKHGLEVRVLSAVPVDAFVEPYLRRKAIQRLNTGRIAILAGGSGNPRFTTDSAAVLRAIEINADLVIKGTKVNGVYDKDPKENDDAKLFDEISHQDFAQQKLRILDLTAVTLAEENNVDIRVFNIFEKGSLTKLFGGEDVGSLITSKK